MTNESIDDIFDGIDFNDEELLKTAEELANFKFSEEPPRKKVPTRVTKPKNTIGSDYFYGLSRQIKMDWDYLPIKKLLVNRYYDRIHSEGLDEKCELKHDALNKINHYRFNERSYKYFCEVEDTLNGLKDNELFVGDFFPYKQLLDFYLRNSKYSKGIEEIKEFLNSGIRADDIALSYLKFYFDIFLTKVDFNERIDFENYLGSIENTNPLADQIFYQRKQYYMITPEKYEFNQSLILLLLKAINAKYLKFEYSIRFYVNLIDCEILYFKALGYSMLGFVCDRMHSSEKFYEYYMDALKIKKEEGNFLESDFDRIFSCAQIEIDFENSDEIPIQDQFDELFSDEFRR